MKEEIIKETGFLTFPTLTYSWVRKKNIINYDTTRTVKYTAIYILDGVKFCFCPECDYPLVWSEYGAGACHKSWVCGKLTVEKCVEAFKQKLNESHHNLQELLTNFVNNTTGNIEIWQISLLASSSTICL